MRVVLASVRSDCDHIGIHWVGKGRGCEALRALQAQELTVAEGVLDFSST